MELKNGTHHEGILRPAELRRRPRPRGTISSGGHSKHSTSVVGSGKKKWAIILKAASPALHLHVQAVSDGEAVILHSPCLLSERERKQARLNVMRVMMGVTASVTYSILRLYVQAVSSLVNHSTPFLIALSPYQQGRLEVLQNTAMRIMLGAPTGVQRMHHAG